MSGLISFCRNAFSHSRERNKDFSPLNANRVTHHDKLDLANLDVGELENRFNLESKKNARKYKNTLDSKLVDQTQIDNHKPKRVLSPKLKVNFDKIYLKPIQRLLKTPHLRQFQQFYIKSTILYHNLSSKQPKSHS